MNRYVIPLLLIVISFGVYIAFIERTYAEIEQGIKQKDELAGYITRAEKVKEKFNELEARAANFPEDGKERLEKMLPEKIDPIVLLIAIEGEAKLLGLTVEQPSVTVDRGTPDNPPPYVEHHVTFNISANYMTFRKFLRAFEKSLALRDFGSISFSTKKSTEEGQREASGDETLSPELAIMDYTVSITTYSLR